MKVYSINVTLHECTYTTLYYLFIVQTSSNTAMIKQEKGVYKHGITKWKTQKLGHTQIKKTVRDNVKVGLSLFCSMITNNTPVFS